MKTIKAKILLIAILLFTVFSVAVCGSFYFATSKAKKDKIELLTNQFEKEMNFVNAQILETENKVMSLEVVAKEYLNNNEKEILKSNFLQLENGSANYIFGIWTGSQDNILFEKSDFTDNFITESYYINLENQIKSVEMQIDRALHLNLFRRKDNYFYTVIKTVPSKNIKVTISVDITENINKLANFQPTKSSFVFVGDLIHDFILFDSDKRIGKDICGKKVSSFISRELCWLNEVLALKDGNSTQIYGSSHYSISLSSKNNLTAIVNIPKEELNFKLSLAFTLSIALSVITLLILIIFISTSLNRNVRNPIKEINQNVGLLSGGSFDVSAKRVGKSEVKNLNANLLLAAENMREQKKVFEQEIAAREFTNSKLEVGNEIQKSVLKTNFDEFQSRNEFDFYAKSIYSNEVSGDFYDAFLLGDNKLCFYAGDVSGKGIEFTMYMAVVKTLLKSLALSNLPPEEIMTRANLQLLSEYKDEYFTCVFFGIFNFKSGILQYVNAGYPKAIFIDKNGAVNVLNKRADFVVGAIETAEYFTHEYEMSKCEKLMLISDGLNNSANRLEIVNDRNNLISELIMLNKTLPQETVDAVINRIEIMRAHQKPTDDIVILCLEYFGETEFKDELVALANLDSLSEVLEFISSPLNKGGFSEKTVMQMSLACEEIFVNIASYAYNNSKIQTSEWDVPDKKSKTITKKGHIIVRYNLFENPKKVVLQFEDNGAAYNPLLFVAKNNISSEGGVGIALIKNIASHIEYERKKGKNILTITKLN